MPVLKLTQQFIDAGLLCPEGKARVEYCDSEVRGLYIEARSTSQGRGSFYLRYKADGISKHQLLEKTSNIDLAEARKRAKTLKAEIRLGADPRAAERARNSMMTLRSFFWDLYEPFARVRKRSINDDVQLFRRIDMAFGARQLNSITRFEIQTYHAKLREEGLAPASADHSLKLIRRLYRLAIDWDVFKEKSPAAGIPLFNVDNKVNNMLSSEELERLLVVLRTDENRPVCRLAMLLLATGARLNEALSAKWENVDLERRLWKISAENAKGKRMRTIPLNDSALEVLGQLGSRGRFEHLFVNQQTGRPYKYVHKVWERLRQTAGLPKLRIHDLRHNFSVLILQSKRSLVELQYLLGHSSPVVTQKYVHFAHNTLLEAAAGAAISVTESTPIKPSTA